MMDHKTTIPSLEPNNDEIKSNSLTNHDSDEDYSPRFETVISTDETIEMVAQQASSSLMARLEAIKQQHKKVHKLIDSTLDILSCDDIHFKLSNKLISSKDFRLKLQSLRNSMLKIDERRINLQIRLNNLRNVLPAKNALVESTPLFYRCVYRGGVRYREYPSSKAKLTGKLLKYHEVVEAVERVFITGESSIFLHIKGTGWLFENKDSLICMERFWPSYQALNQPSQSLMKHNSSSKADEELCTSIKSMATNNSNNVSVNINKEEVNTNQKVACLNSIEVALRDDSSIACSDDFK